VSQNFAILLSQNHAFDHAFQLVVQGPGLVLSKGVSITGNLSFGACAAGKMAVTVCGS
jgi:hypothetical protein